MNSSSQPDAAVPHEPCQSCASIPGATEDSFLLCASWFLFGIFVILALLALVRGCESLQQKRNLGVLTIFIGFCIATRAGYFALNDVAMNETNPGLGVNSLGHFTIFAMGIGVLGFLRYYGQTVQGHTWMLAGFGALLELCQAASLFVFDRAFDEDQNLATYYDLGIAIVASACWSCAMIAYAYHATEGRIMPERDGSDAADEGPASGGDDQQIDMAVGLSYLKHRLYSALAVFGVARAFATLINVILLIQFAAHNTTNALIKDVEVATMLYLTAEVLPWIKVIWACWRSPVPAEQSRLQKCVRRACTFLRLEWASSFSIYLILMQVVLAVWGAHKTCYAATAALGWPLVLARAGAAPMYFLTPAVILTACHGVFGYLHIPRVGMLFPVPPQGHAKYHREIGYAFVFWTALHVAGHIWLAVTCQSVTTDEVFCSGAAAACTYCRQLRAGHAGRWLVPWTTGWFMIIIVGVMILAYHLTYGIFNWWRRSHRYFAYALFVCLTVHPLSLSFTKLPIIDIAAAFALCMVLAERIICWSRSVVTKGTIEQQLRTQADHRKPVLVLTANFQSAVDPGAWMHVGLPEVDGTEIHPFSVAGCRNVGDAFQLEFHIQVSSQPTTWTNRVNQWYQQGLNVVGEEAALLGNVQVRLVGPLQTSALSHAYQQWQARPIKPRLVLVGLGTGAAPLLSIVRAHGDVQPGLIFMPRSKNQYFEHITAAAEACNAKVISQADWSRNEFWTQVVQEVGKDAVTVLYCGNRRGFETLKLKLRGHGNVDIVAEVF